MTVTVANTSNTSTFEYWLNRTNELADAMTNKTITVNSNNTTGNAFVNGVFSATTMAVNTDIRGGDTTTSRVLTVSSNLAVNGNILTVGSNLQLNTSTVFIGNSTVNTVINSSSLSLGTVIINSTSFSISGNVITSSSIASLPSVVNVQTTGTSSQIVDFFDLSTHRTVEYTLSITDNNANSHQSSKILLTHNIGNTYITEYAVLYTNSQLGVFSSNANTTHCRLILTPLVTNTQIKGIKSLIVV